MIPFSPPPQIYFFIMVFPLCYIAFAGALLPFYNSLTARDFFLPLAGILAVGLMRMLCLVLGLDLRVGLVLLSCASVVGFIRGAPGRSIFPPRVMFTLYAFYCLLLLVVSTLPLPGLYYWCMDWWGVLRDSNIFTATNENLQIISQRSPLMGFSAVIAKFFFPPVMDIQLLSALIGTGLMLATMGAYRELNRRELRTETIVLVLCTSSMLLLHILTMWSKPLAAGTSLFCVACLARFFQSNERRDLLLAAFWCGVFVLIHQSAIIYLPVMAYFIYAHTQRQNLRGSTFAAQFLLVTMATWCWFELWLSLKLGLDSRIHRSPTVEFDSGTPFGQKMLFNLVSSTSGWPIAYFIQIVRMIQGGVAIGYSEMVQSLGVIVCSAAGTLVGIFGPAVLLAYAGVRRYFKQFKLTDFVYGITALTLILVTHAALSPYPEFFGIAQNGLLPLSIVAWLFLLPIIEESRVAWKIAIFQSLFGLAPILILNLSVGALLFGSDSLQILAANESVDLHYFIDVRGVTLWQISSWGTSAMLLTLSVLAFALSSSVTGRKVD